MPRPWLALLAVVLAAAGCTGQPAASASASASTEQPAAVVPPRPVKVFAAVEERVPRTVASTGALAADDTVVLGVKVPGRLVEQAVDLGTRVRKDQVVARIDQTDYKLRVEQAAAARQQLIDTVLVSPFDGAVSLKQAAVGEYLAAGAPVATLVRTHPLRLRLPVPEREAAGVRVGQTVRLTLEGAATVHQGRVVRLSP